MAPFDSNETIIKKPLAKQRQFMITLIEVIYP